MAAQKFKKTTANLSNLPVGAPRKPSGENNFQRSLLDQYSS